VTGDVYRNERGAAREAAVNERNGKGGGEYGEKQTKERTGSEV
jgi:hypothetical protein